MRVSELHWTEKSRGNDRYLIFRMLLRTELHPFHWSLGRPRRKPRRPRVVFSATSVGPTNHGETTLYDWNWEGVVITDHMWSIDESSPPGSFFWVVITCATTGRCSSCLEMLQLMG